VGEAGKERIRDLVKNPLRLALRDSKTQQTTYKCWVQPVVPNLNVGFPLSLQPKLRFYPNLTAIEGGLLLQKLLVD